MNSVQPDNPSPPASVPFREIVTNAIRYWELRRLWYNVALAGIVLAYFYAGLPASRVLLNTDGVLDLAVLAILANVCYCAAYVVDVFAQFSGFRAPWLRWRWLLLLLGIAFAGILTRSFALGFLAAPHID